ncbi:response regulator transcription factor [Flavobacterium sp. MAH-1]|uniref:Response regulator transcription factor n=1 Tax=Flavobacterium agri TaxID=2743471 RepID=A0A7Y9C4N6_9FLAO|nr:LytTR family DNA-binding domain-containing protein [Flavobacterium agri]NUY80371.1 response regulator transcription factor [Flavobacterium agri]NYA70396.1 response regulator transcription factor [Flavobacterium agri]
MIDVILIDDEPMAIRSLEWELQNFCKDVSIVATFSNASSAIDYLKSHVVDCVFLDIEMPGMDGFQFLEFFPNRNFGVVITTAYDQYAIKAIREKAIDYLLKPIDSDDLVACVNNIALQKNKPALSEKLEQTLEAMLQKNQSGAKKISVPCDGKIIFLEPDSILYCESDGNYCTIFLENKEKILITQKLKFMEEKLSDSHFFRVHNSYLVNLNKIREYHKSDEYVVLSNQVKIPVSRQKKASFLDKL